MKMVVSKKLGALFRTPPKKDPSVVSQYIRAPYSWKLPSGNFHELGGPLERNQGLLQGIRG